LPAPATAIAISLAILGTAGLARAEVQRFAVLIGNNEGERDEVALRYAESDAVKLRDVLVDLGNFRSENVTLLQGQAADSARRAIITVNDRIRTLSSGTDAVLFVYYSGHADASALHMGDSSFDLDELERLVRGSSAEVRLLVLDACRSGALTRVKGGKRKSGFSIQLDEQLVSCSRLKTGRFAWHARCSYPRSKRRVGGLDELSGESSGSTRQWDETNPRGAWRRKPSRVCETLRTERRRSLRGDIVASGLQALMSQIEREPQGRCQIGRQTTETNSEEEAKLERG
jgi:hypothetical protein